MARSSPSFWKRSRQRNSCSFSNCAIWKGCLSARRLLDNDTRSSNRQNPKRKRTTKSWIWQPFRSTRSIANMAYLTGEARVQLDAFKAVMVKHARLSEVDAALQLLIEEHADSTHVLLCGPGGVGKSTVLKGVTERFTREETNATVVPIVLLEPLPSDTGPYVRLDYYRQIVNALKGHILVKELFVNVAHLMATPKASRTRPGITDWLDMREAAEQALVRSQVKAVLIDEGHRLMQGGGQHTVDEQLEWLKSLTTRTNVLHVLAGPYELFPFRNTSGQLVRRGRDLHFARYHGERSDELKAFVAAVKYLLERVPL